MCYWYVRMLFGSDKPGDRERALEMLGKARSLSEEMGMKALIRVISEYHNG